MNRLIPLAGLLACAAALGYAYYAEYVLFLDPCPLCMLQRIAMIVLALVFLVAFIHGKHLKIYAAVSQLAAAGGAAIAARHVWIQKNPSSVATDCGGDWNFLVSQEGFLGAVGKAFVGTGDCASIDWLLLGLSMPAWVLLMFVGFGLAALLVLCLPTKAGIKRPPPPPV